MIKLGEKITDAVTGLTGIVWCRVEYLVGDTQYGLMLLDESGKAPDVYYVDENRLMAKSIKELQELKGEPA